MKQAIGTALVLVTALLCIRLGVWQLQRLSERRAVNQLISDRSALAPVHLDQAEGSELLAFRAARAAGRFDYTRQIIRVGRPSNGVPGVVILTPLLLDDSMALLVERGWTPSPDARTVDLARLTEPDSATLQGVLVEGSAWSAPRSDKWPLYLPGIHPDSVQARYPYRLLPLIFRRTDVPSHSSDAVFRPVQSPALSNGPHLGYAMQWFSFAAIALVGGWLLLYRNRGERANQTIDSRPT